MRTDPGRFVGRLTTVVLAVSMVGAPAAYADQHPGPGLLAEPPHDVLDVGYDPVLSEDARITDDMEAQLPPGGGGDGGSGCSFETVQTGPNPVPAAPSFQHLYVVPSDQASVGTLDVPRSCGDGSIQYSSLARASRNTASWLAAQGAGLNFRTITINYTHNTTGGVYATRGVRRFRSAYSASEWSSTALSDGTSVSPRLSKLRDELVANRFTVANTKYMALLHAETQRVCPSSGQCGHVVGVAQRGGTYGMTLRSYVGTSPKQFLRYGCASDGDAVMAHEMTHMVNVSHTTDHAYDLMSASKAPVDFNSSPALIWDYQRNSYHSTVRASSYASLTSQPGGYFTC